MKELSMEEKAQRYDEALKAAVVAHKDEDKHLKATLERIFPALKESEDERIKNALIHLVNSNKELSFGIDNYDGVKWCDIIAWLEKQGEQKPAEFDDTNAKRMFIKALERVEEQNAKGYKLTDCDKNSWWEDFKNYTSCTIEQKSAGWSEILIADVFEMVGLAKIVREQENDALTEALQSAMIELAKYSVVPQQKQGEQKSVLIIPKFRVGDEIKTSNEESLTITKIDEKGYWSEDLFICDFDDSAKWKLVEQNPAWSEEDEKILNLIIARLHSHPNVEVEEYGKDYHWLKSLKGRVQLQPQQEWGEKDKGNLLDVKCIIDEVWHNQYVRETIDHSCEELESLWHWLDNIWQRVEYSQNTWKPSDEQMRVLDLAIRCGINRGTTEETILVSLFNDLKKLTE